MVINGVAVYVPHSEAECMALIEQLGICRNCCNFMRPDVFGDGKCAYLKRDVNGGNCCEEFMGDKKTEYWMNKLTAIIMDVDPEINDFQRQLDYHQKMGTDWEFLGLTKPVGNG